MCCHALSEFTHQYPDTEIHWFKNSNYIVLLSVKDKIKLQSFVDNISRQNIKYSLFFEPDLGGELASVALEPSNISKRLCRNLKLLS